jgi:hypothetical protein
MDVPNERTCPIHCQHLHHHWSPLRDISPLEFSLELSLEGQQVTRVEFYCQLDLLPLGDDLVMSTLTRLGRVKHPKLGPCVKIEVRLDYKQQQFLFPKNQSPLRACNTDETWTVYSASRSRRAVEGFRLDGTTYGLFTPAVSFFNDLIKYGEFRW